MASLRKPSAVDPGVAGAPLSRCAARLRPISLSRREFLRCVAGAAGFMLLNGCRRRSGSFGPVIGDLSSQRAVEAAKRFSGITLQVGWETGPQAHGLKNYEVPLWEKLTGMRVNVVEMGGDLDRFKRLIEEHRAETGALDCASVDPEWVPDLLQEGALEPLDDYIAHFMVPGDLEDFLPLYRELATWDRRRYGLFDDGDTLLLYFRKDLFEDPENQRQFAAKHGRALGDPRSYDWEQFVDAARFFNAKYAPNLYAVAPLDRELFWSVFQCRLRVDGGEFFDPVSMKPGVNAPAGQRAMGQIRQLMELMVPVGAMDPSFATTITSYLSGKSAMAIFWPPLGRWAEHPAPPSQAFSFVPPSQVAGKTGFALLPDGVTEMAVGFMLSVMAESAHKEAAYLFCQWLNSPDISLQRVMRSDNLRDPFRLSHIRSPQYRSLWHGAASYLDTLGHAASGGALLDLMMPGANEYEASFYEILTNIRLGQSSPAALEELARLWDEITNRRGRSRQRQGYAAFLERKDANYQRRKPPGTPDAK